MKVLTLKHLAVILHRFDHFNPMFTLPPSHSSSAKVLVITIAHTDLHKCSTYKIQLYIHNELYYCNRYDLLCKNIHFNRTLIFSM